MQKLVAVTAVICLAIALATPLANASREAPAPNSERGWVASSMTWLSATLAALLGWPEVVRLGAEAHPDFDPNGLTVGPRTPTEGEQGAGQGNLPRKPSSDSSEPGPDIDPNGGRSETHPPTK